MTVQTYVPLIPPRAIARPQSPPAPLVDVAGWEHTEHVLPARLWLVPVGGMAMTACVGVALPLLTSPMNVLWALVPAVVTLVADHFGPRG